jgi:hypothetical protein
MIQNIAHKVITINEKPSPCECTDTVVCSYCVLANMTLWERGKQKKDIEPHVITRIRKEGIRRTSRLLGVEHKTVMRWIKNKAIPRVYEDKLIALWGQNHVTLHAGV